MPETSQSHADLHVLPDAQASETGLDKLEASIHRAVQAIQAMQEERAALRSELEETQQRLKTLETSKVEASSQSREVTKLVAERDRLLADRVRTAARVESMLNRLKDLGLE